MIHFHAPPEKTRNNIKRCGGWGQGKKTWVAVPSTCLTQKVAWTPTMSSEGTTALVVKHCRKAAICQLFQNSRH